MNEKHQTVISEAIIKHDRFQLKTAHSTKQKEKIFKQMNFQTNEVQTKHSIVEIFTFETKNGIHTTASTQYQNKLHKFSHSFDICPLSYIFREFHTHTHTCTRKISQHHHTVAHLTFRPWKKNTHAHFPTENTYLHMHGASIHRKIRTNDWTYTPTNARRVFPFDWKFSIVFLLIWICFRLKWGVARQWRFRPIEGFSRLFRRVSISGGCHVKTHVTSIERGSFRRRRQRRATVRATLRLSQGRHCWEHDTCSRARRARVPSGAPRAAENRYAPGDRSGCKNPPSGEFSRLYQQCPIGVQGFRTARNAIRGKCDGEWMFYHFF